MVMVLFLLLGLVAMMFRAFFRASVVNGGRCSLLAAGVRGGRCVEAASGEATLVLVLTPPATSGRPRVRSARAARAWTWLLVAALRVGALLRCRACCGVADALRTLTPWSRGRVLV